MSSRALLFGLDGATFDVIDPLLAAGKLPALRGLMARGVRAPLRSTCPALSAPAWVTFLTGTNPGRHGVFNFQNLDAGNYSGFSRSLVNSSYFSGRTLLDHAGRRAVRSLAYRIPMTYPPWDVPNGVLVSGFPVPDRRRTYARPVDVERELGSANSYSYDEMAQATRELEVEIVDASNRIELEALEQTTNRYLSRGYELLVAFTGIPDTLHHAFWSYHDQASPIHEPDAPDEVRRIIERWYVAIDAAIGRMTARLDPDTAIIVLSDHGGGPAPSWSVGFNAFLRERGYLTTTAGGRARLARRVHRFVEYAQENVPGRFWLKSRLPANVTGALRGLRNGTGAVDWRRTRAYATPIYHPVTGVWVNLAGRQPSGTVRPGAEYDALRAELTRELLTLYDPETGHPVVEHVAYREDVYTGPHVDRAPDLVVTTASDYHGGPSLDRVLTRVPATTLRSVSGSHTAEGIFIAAAGPFRTNVRLRSADLADVLPTALHLLGVPLPEELDGRVLFEALEPSWAAEHPVRLAAVEGVSEGSITIEVDEEREMRKYLKGLGYLD